MEKERALAGYKQDLAAAHDEKAKQAIIKKYHMVRFFGASLPPRTPLPRSLTPTNPLTPPPFAPITERQKATRALSKLTRLLSTTPSSSPAHLALQAQRHAAQVDLNYALYYPLHEKYTSLYPRAGPGPETAEEKGEADRPPLWRLVEKCMVEGTLEALRDGKVGGKGRGRPGGEGRGGRGGGEVEGRGKGGAKRAEKAGNRGGVGGGGGFEGTAGKVEGGSGDEEVSDGGFFEE